MAKSLRIFHIDDNRGDLQLMREALAPHKNVAHESVDEPVTAIGRMAQHAIAGTPPALIVLDLNLPGIDGQDMLQLLASNSELRKIPVVVLTSSDRENERDACLRLGAVAFITKPGTFEELCATASTLVGIAGGVRLQAKAAKA
ncbi:MAG: response regulator [Planctomycetes bacterium]|nr:response regulator [Planctomycetota bacterium]